MPLPPRQRQPRQTCPICGRRNLAIVNNDVLTKHDPQHDEWKHTPWCGGGGLSMECARATRDIIKKLVRESVVLRQIERGFQLSGVNRAVGMTPARLKFRRNESTSKAEGVEHSVNLLRGFPASGTLDDE